MNVFLNSIALLLTVFAAYGVVVNYACAIAGSWNKFRGIDRGHSMVLLVPQLVLVMAEIAFSAASSRWVPRPWLLTIALADIGLWCLLVWLIVLLFRCR